MDRSFLTDASVIEASRDFVCIRVATYESESEARFMRSLFTRNGSVENTTFAILAPDGRTRLARAGRGPQQFRNARSLAAAMNSMSSRYKKRTSAQRVAAVPAMESIELATNVAACDNLPLVVVAAETEAELMKLKAKVAQAAWTPELAGLFVYGVTTKSRELRPFTGSDATSGVFVVEPGEFGLTGKVLEHLPVDVSPEEIELRLATVADTFDRQPVDHQRHVQSGIAFGFEWETKLPETDAQSIRAKERAWGRN